MPAHRPSERDATPSIYHLKGEAYCWQADWNQGLRGFDLRLPSPFDALPGPSLESRNQTVPVEIYTASSNRQQAVIVLHTLSGDLELSRKFCQQFQQRGFTAALVTLPYYGPRRTPGSPRRMIDRDPRVTLVGMQQAVLDVRRTLDWLLADSQSIVSCQTVSLFGVSLGGIVGALVAAFDARCHAAYLALAGGGLHQLGWDSPEMRRPRQVWEKTGLPTEDYFRYAEQFDPVSFGKLLSDKRVRLFAAEQDRSVPPQAAAALAEAIGNCSVQWFPSGHYEAINHLLESMDEVTAFFEG